MYNVIQIKFGSPEYHESISLRNRLLRKPLGFELSDSDLEHENKQYHFAISNKNKIIACVVLKPKNSNTITLRQMVVESKFQKKGLGKKIIKFAEEKVAKYGYSKVQMSARLEAIGFYEQLNYNKIGSTYESLGINHIKMEKSLSSTQLTNQ